jgi:rhodanese-related sulfurtransferase
MANIVAREVDHVDPTELADWIVRGETGYRLIDLRTPAEFAAYHIPTAENIPLAGLMDAGLGRDERLVLYSEGGIHSAQAWFLLRAERYPAAYILRGGLEAWSDEVLHPVAPADPTPQQAAAFERSAHVARFFGGSPRAAAAAPLPQAAATPAPTLPATPRPAVGTAVPQPVRKKKEGC